MLSVDERLSRLSFSEIRVVPTPYEETLEKCLATYQRAGKGTYTYEPPK